MDFFDITGRQISIFDSAFQTPLLRMHSA